MSAAKLRIGILGCANIANKNVIAIAASEGCEVTAVASRNLDKAQQFVQARGLDASTTTIFGGPDAYTELVQSDTCDALYIPLPTSLHKEWVIQALQADKHVLLEKPVALSAREFQEMWDLAQARGKLLMDGTMFPHHPRTQQMLNVIADGALGAPPHRVEVAFSFRGDDNFFQSNVRVKADSDALGCIGDLGWYCIRVALLVYDKVEMGTPVSAQAVDYTVNDQGVPIHTSCLVKFAQDRTLFFHCGFTTPMRMGLEICGTDKILRVNDFVLPVPSQTSFAVENIDLTNHDIITTFQRRNIVVESTLPQEVLMWNTFARLAFGLEASWGGVTGEEAKKWARFTLTTQAICDALMQSIRQNGAKIDL